MTTAPPHRNLRPSAVNNAASSANDDLKLQVATQYCTNGRQLWSQGNYEQALADFRRALVVLETLLGGQHVLVAQLYHWMGLILQKQSDFKCAEQCFVKYLRIRYAVEMEKGPSSISSTPVDSTVMETQVSLSNLWQTQGISSHKSFQMIRNLQESVRLEREADAMLSIEGTHEHQHRQQNSPNYVLAIKIYQKSMNAFPDEHHDTVMVRMARCYHRARDTGGVTDSPAKSNYFLDQSVGWYRMAIKAFCTSCRFSTSLMDPNSNHHPISTHPVYQKIQQQLETVLHDYRSFDFDKINEYVGHGRVITSVLHQHAADVAMKKSLVTSDGDIGQSSEIISGISPTIDDLEKARKEYYSSLSIERCLFQQSEDQEHLVVSNLQKELARIDQKYITKLEEERSVSKERLQLLEHQSSDWVSTVRHQEQQLQNLQSSLESKEGHTADALNNALSKEAELVGWKRKFENLQSDWKESQKDAMTLAEEKNALQQLLIQTENKFAQLEYTFKKQDLDIQRFNEIITINSKEVETWKGQYQIALQCQRQAEEKRDRSTAMERELQAQIKDLQSQNLVLKDWNKELQSEQQIQSRSITVNNPQQLQAMETQIKGLQTKLNEVTTTKDRAIKKLKKYHLQRQKQRGGAEEATEVIIFLEDRIQVLERENASLQNRRQEQSQKAGGHDNGKKKTAKQTIDSSEKDGNVNTESLAARLEKSNDALATLHAKHREKLSQVAALEEAKTALELGAMETQEILAVLKKTSEERVERIEELKAENEKLRAQLKPGDVSVVKLRDVGDIAANDHLDPATSNMLIDQVAELELQNEELREQVDKTTEDNRNLAAAVRSLKDKLCETKEASSKKEVYPRTFEPELESNTSDHTESMDRRLNDAEKSNEEMAARIENMRNQIRILTSPQLDDSSDRSSVRTTVLETELRQAKQQIETLSANSKVLQKHSESNRKLVEEKEALVSHIAVLEKQMEELSSNEHKLLEKLEGSNEKLKSTRQELEQKEQLLDRFNSLEQNSEATSSHRDQLKSENFMLKKQLDSAQEQIKEQKNITSRFTQLEHDLERCQKENAELETELKKVKPSTIALAQKDEEIRDLASQVEELQYKLQVSQKENKKLSSSEALSPQNQQNSSTDTLQEANMRLLEQCSILEQEVHTLRDQNNELVGKEADRAKELTITEESHQQLQKRCLSLEKRLHEAMAQNHKVSSKEDDIKEEFTVQLERENQERQRLKSECVKLEKKLLKSGDQKERLTLQVESLSDEVAELQSKLSDIENDHLEEQDELIKRCHDLEQKLQLNLGGIESPGPSVGPEKVSQLEEEIQDLRQQNNSLKYEMSRHANDAGPEKVSQLEEEIQDLRQQNNSLKCEMSRHANDAEKIAEIEQELQILREENKTLHSEVTQYQEKSEDAIQDESQELTERCSSLEQELLETVEQNEELSKQVAALGEKVRGLETYVSNASTELQIAQDMIKTLEAREAPGDDDFARLLERCTDLEAEKSTIEHELQQNRGGSDELEKVKRERDELQQELDDALADLVEIQQVQGGRSSPSAPQNNLNDRLEALADAKDELKKLLEEAVEENAVLVQSQKKLSETVKKAQQDRDDIDSLFQQSRQESAELKSQMIAFEELLKESKAESEELARLLEIEKQVSSSRKAAVDAGPEDQNELEELYRQAREEMKELEEMLMEAEEQVEHLKSKCEKLEKSTELSRQDFIQTELSSETVHSLNGLSRDELIKENRKVLHKLQEARTHAIDQQENITILQAQLRDALKFHETKRAPQRKSSGDGGPFGGFFNRGKKDAPKKTEEEIPQQEAAQED